MYIGFHKTMIKYAKFKFSKNVYDSFWFLDFSWNTCDIERNSVPSNIVRETLIYGINHFMITVEEYWCSIRSFR